MGQKMPYSLESFAYNSVFTVTELDSNGKELQGPIDVVRMHTKRAYALSGVLDDRFASKTFVFDVPEGNTLRIVSEKMHAGRSHEDGYSVVDAQFNDDLVVSYAQGRHHDLRPGGHAGGALAVLRRSAEYNAVVVSTGLLGSFVPPIVFAVSRTPFACITHEDFSDYHAHGSDHARDSDFATRMQSISLKIQTADSQRQLAAEAHDKAAEAHDKADATQDEIAVAQQEIVDMLWREQKITEVEHQILCFT